MPHGRNGPPPVPKQFACYRRQRLVDQPPARCCFACHGADSSLNVYVEHIGKRRPTHPEPAASMLDEIASSDAVFTADTGMCNVWSSRYIHPTKARRVIGSFMHGSMANASPQAIGAQLAFPAENHCRGVRRKADRLSRRRRRRFLAALAAHGCE